MSNDKKPSDNRSATQRLTDAENAIMSLFNVLDKMTRDLMTLREAIKLIHNKVDSIVKASVGGEPINDAVLERLMIENNVAELKQKVDSMVQQGVIASEEQVSDNSFVVGSEYNDEGTLINPRLQFILKSLTEELQLKLLGTKPGDLLDLQEGKLKFKVLESYKIQEHKAAAPALQAVPNPAPEAPTTPAGN